MANRKLEQLIDYGSRLVFGVDSAGLDPVGEDAAGELPLESPWKARLQSLLGNSIDTNTLDLPPGLELDDVRLVRAYGSAILKSAYALLGNDANEMIEKYRSASSSDERQAVYMWLMQRLNYDFPDQLKTTEDKELTVLRVPNIVEGLGHVFSPLTLLPDVVGEYPGLKARPSCLLESAAVASFMHNAGLETMLHSGQTEARRTVLLRGTEYIGQLTERLAEERSAEVSPFARDLIDRHRRLLGGLGLQGNHAFVIAKDPDGWVQLDMVLSGFARLDDERYEDAYRTIRDDPRVELTVHNDEPEDVERLDHVSADRLIDLCIPKHVALELAKQADADGITEGLIGKSLSVLEAADYRDVQQKRLQTLDIGGKEGFEDFAVRMMRKCILPEIQEGQAIDEESRLRAIADNIQLWPLYYHMIISADYHDEIFKRVPHLPHSYVEVGDIMLRMGMCFLHDLDQLRPPRERLAVDEWAQSWTSMHSLAPTEGPEMRVASVENDKVVWVRCEEEDRPTRCEESSDPLKRLALGAPTSRLFYRSNIV